MDRGPSGRRWAAFGATWVVALGMCLAGCSGSSASAAASQARALCHEIKTAPEPDGVAAVKAALTRNLLVAQRAAKADDKWKPLASALADEQSTYATATAPGASTQPGATATFLRAIDRDEHTVSQSCALADPQDAWGRSVSVSARDMEPTLEPGDNVVYKAPASAADIKRGSIIVFTGPAGWSDYGVSTRFLKRVIGLGGERIVCCNPQGRITINGKPLDEPYLYPGNRASDTPFDVRIPPGQLWVMGDHREDSADSRAHIREDHGTVPEQNVVGIVTQILSPKSRAKLITTPSYATG